MTSRGQRARLGYIGAALATIVAGLLVHLSDTVPPVARDIAGDALWAMMVAWWIGALAPGTSPWIRAVFALAIAWTVELSQLYHAPWIDGLRKLRVVHLVIGSDFYARDLIAYAVGVLSAALLELGRRVYLRSMHPDRHHG